MRINIQILPFCRQGSRILNIRKIQHPLLSILCLLCLSACQLTALTQPPSMASDYYLWIQSLSNSELQQEITQQQRNKSAGLKQADINLILLYALPASPVYNPYTAKSMLNNISTDPVHAQLSTQDYALLSLLREQLNQHILTLNKLLANKQLTSEQQLAHQTAITEKQQLIDKLQQQISQLKRIELAIENEQ